MYLKFIFLLTIIVSSGFKRGNDRKEILELLTGKQWTLSSYGYDSNNDGLIDETEERIEECEKDNTYSFNSNGTALYLDNASTCSTGITEQAFTWNLLNDSLLDLHFFSATILRVNQNELILSIHAANAQPADAGCITIFKY